MKSEIKIILCVSILIIIVFCVFNKEKFTNTSPPPSSTSSQPSPSPSAGISADALLNADNTINNLRLFANNLSSVDTKNVSATELADVKNQLTEQINQLSTILNNINNNLVVNNTSTDNNLDNVNGIDLITTQLVQNKEIEQLTERLNKLKAMHQMYQQNSLLNNQPRIPIYSSCIVSEASGSYSFDDPNKTSTNNQTQEKPIVYAGQSVVPGVQTYNPNKDLNLNSKSFNLEDILNELAQNKINVNFNT
jgi:hypothetical protein